tara:strand:- start:117 stop:395 length:279 start_codon:yes stop_codon:yes gene_type:complete
VSFNLNDIIDEIVLDEMTTTVDVEGYNTPFAFSGEKKHDKKKNKKISTNSTGYKVVKEAVDDRDLKLIRLIIRDEVSEIFKTLWQKKATWKS